MQPDYKFHGRGRARLTSAGLKAGALASGGVSDLAPLFYVVAKNRVNLTYRKA